MGKLFDTHAHYTDERFLAEETLVDELFMSDISHILTVATGIEDGYQCIALAEKHEHMYASSGIHPHETAKIAHIDEAMCAIEKQLAHEKVVALGEIGLDYYYDFSDKESQMRLFRAQMELAEKTGKPVIIHDREAHGDVMDMIRAFKGRVRGVIHSCSCSAEQVKEYAKMDWYISFSGVITFKNASKTLDSLLATPIEKLLFETDCPYLAPVPKRGKTNHSGYLHYTAEKAAELLSMDYEALCKTEVENAKALFGLI